MHVSWLRRKKLPPIHRRWPSKTFCASLHSVAISWWRPIAWLKTTVPWISRTMTMSSSRRSNLNPSELARSAAIVKKMYVWLRVGIWPYALSVGTRMRTRTHARDAKKQSAASTLRSSTKMYIFIFFSCFSSFFKFFSCFSTFFKFFRHFSWFFRVFRHFSSFFVNFCYFLISKSVKFCCKMENKFYKSPVAEHKMRKYFFLYLVSGK